MRVNASDKLAEALIHLLMDDCEQALHFAQVLHKEGFHVQVFERVEAFRKAITTITAQKPDVLVIDWTPSEEEDEGLGLIQELTQDNHLPVVVLSVRDDIHARLKAFRAGVSRYLIKPVTPGRLSAVLNPLIGLVPNEPYRVLLVGDDALLLDAHAAMLLAAGMEVHTLTEPLQILQVMHTFRPDVVVLDMYMPEATGAELAAVLREDDTLLHLPILFLSAQSDISQQLTALSLGGDDFLVKPVRAEHLVAAVTARARRARQTLALRRRLETTLLERERERLSLDHHAIVSVADATGTITYINDKFCEISGYSRRELIGQNHRIVKSGEHPLEFYEDMWQTIAGGQVWRGEICNRRKDASLYWVESTITPHLDDNGLPYQYVSLRTNITHVKTTEQKLAKKAMQLNATLESTNDGILAVDAGGKVLFMNHRFRTIWGIPDGLDRGCADELLLTHALTQLVNPQDFLEKVKTLYHSEGESNDLIELTDGRIFERHSKPLQDHGLRTGRVWSFHDITKRRRAEQAAEAAKERLRRGQIYANIGTWEWNIATGDLYWTERIATLFGYPLGDLETTYENFLNVVHPDDRQAVVDAVNACVEQDTPYEIEHRVVWPDGTVRWLLERGAVQRDAEGKPLNMIGVVQDVDDRKRAEMALADRERELLEAQRLASIGNWTADFVTGQLIWSDEIYRIFGHQPGSFSPSVAASHAAVHPDDLERVHESEREAEKTGHHDVTHRIVRPDGTVHHVHELAKMHFDHTGQPIRLTGTVQDVTEQVEYEQRERESQQRFTFAVEGAGDGVWDWQVKTGRMRFSAQYEPMLGYAPDELVEHVESWRRSVHPDDLGPIEQQLTGYLAGKNAQYSVEFRLQCKDGRYKWVLCRGTVVERDEQGDPVRMIGIHSDIDERKSNEKALHIYQHVVNSVLDGVLVINAAGVINLASPSVQGIFGYELQDLIGHPVSRLMPEPIRSEHDGYLDRYLTRREARILNRTIEVTGRRADGLEIPIEISVSEITFSEQPYFVALLRDISERKESERLLIHAREAADRANQAKSEFLSNMSHELRTPLNAILGFGQLMEMEEGLPAEQRDNAHEIVKAGRHLLDLVNEVLDLAKVESGRIDLSLETVELQPLVQECVALVQPLAEPRGIQVRSADASGLRLRTDRTRLKQVLLNLLSNAIKYNHDHGQVALELEPQSPTALRLTVRDTGHGIPADRLPDLFQPFNRLGAEGGNIEGTGIGLTITRRIVELMGGQVGVNSVVGTGSAFWIELPQLQTASESEDDQAPARTDAPDEPEADASGLQAATHKHTLLYFEDNPANLRLVAQILGHRPNIRLHTAHLPSLGIELALALKPEMILLDINLPHMDGYQVLKVLKAEPSLRHIPVVALTANALPRDIDRGMAAGFTDYLTKPLNVVKFLDVLDRTLNQDKERIT